MIKKNVRKPTDILQQLYIRNLHTNLIKELKTFEFKEKNCIICSIALNDFSLSVKAPNNICLMLPYKPLTIISFKRDQNNEVIVVGRRFKNICSFFEGPIDSISALGICIAENILEESEDI